MSASFVELVAAVALFVGGHLVVSSTPLRGGVVRAVGERGYLALFSLLMVALIVWVVVSYADAPFVPVWEPAPWTRWIPIVVMPFAFVLLVGGSTQRNPTAVMQAAPSARDDRELAPGILAVTRHPVMWAIGLWALAHLTANGDLASIILMGAMAVLALGGTVLLDRKKAKAWGPDWPAFAAVSSNLPLAAVLAGRNHLSLARIGWWRLALALLLYLGLMHLHGAIIGVPVFF